jgi:zinc protease
VALGKLEASKRLVYEDRVQVPRLYIQWPTVGFKHDDDYALSVMSSILSGSRTARLTKALVYDSQKASQVGAFQNSAEDVGVFQVTVVPRPESSLTDLEVAVDQVLQKFISEGPTAEELQKAKSGLELGFLRGLESNLGKANQLINGAVFYGNPYRLPEDTRRHCRRREARREPVSDALAYRAECGAKGQEGSGFKGN